MNSSVKYIQFDFATQSNEEIRQQALKYSNDSRSWVKKCADLILEWLNTEDFINAQSSGTTGIPKEFKIQKDKIIASSKLTAQAFDLKKGSSVLLCLSTDFIAGKMMVARSEVNRWNLYAVEPSANPLNDIDLNLDFAAFVPNQVFEILSSPSNLKINNIKKIIIGGGEINSALKSLLKDTTSEVYQTFGMTETVSHIAIKQIRPIEEEYYKALPGIHFEVDRDGCLIIHAPQLNQNAFFTKDCVEIIDKTSFQWLGRFDNIINSGAVKLNPEAIEQKIRSRITNEFIVSSIPDDKLINKLILLVEGTATINLSEINNVLDRYEQLREVKFISEFPRTASGKIIRKF